MTTHQASTWLLIFSAIELTVATVLPFCCFQSTLPTAAWKSVVVPQLLAAASLVAVWMAAGGALKVIRLLLGSAGLWTICWGIAHLVGEFVEWAVYTGMIAASIGAPLLLARGMEYRWINVNHNDRSSPPNKVGRCQFRVQDIFVFIALLAPWLAISRYASLSPNEWIFLGVLMLILAPVTLMFFWSTITSRSEAYLPHVILVVGIGMTCQFDAGPAELLRFCTTQLAVVHFALTAVRALGYRYVRPAKPVERC